MEIMEPSTSCDSSLKKAEDDGVTATTTISDLPDEILVRILSLLTTEDAVKTVVIRGFGDLWRAVPVLDFNSRGDPRVLGWQHLNDGVSRMIPHVLNLHCSDTLDKLCIRLAFPIYDAIVIFDARTMDLIAPYPQAMIDCVKKSIVYAIKRKVKMLELNFNVYGYKITDEPHLYDLSDHHVLVSDHLTDLRLAACDISSCRNVNLKSLKVLFLNEVSMSDAMMDQVLVGCPLLEDLSLVDLSLNKLTCRNPKLKKLMLTRNKYDCCVTHVACPYVLRLEIIGVLRTVVLLDASSVIDFAIHVAGDVHLYSIGSIGLNRVFWDLMQKTSHCKIFRAGGWAVEELTACGYRFCDWPSFCCKSLVLEMSLRMENQPGIALLLKNSQSLETLTLHFHPKETYKFVGGPIYKGVWKSFEQGAMYWKTSFPCLVTIKIYGCINDWYVLQLVHVLLRHAIRLKRLVISTKDIDCPFGRHDYHYTSELMRKLSHVYKALPRASREARVYFDPFLQ